MPCSHGGQLNCFALLSRTNECFVRTTEATITGDWLAEQLDLFSQGLKRLTVIVLDNASVPRGTEFRRRFTKKWYARIAKDGNKAAYTSASCRLGILRSKNMYSPHLNIVETLWKKLKYEWLRAKDYANKETLHGAVNAILRSVGTTYRIAFSPFQMPEAGLTQI